ncbi:MAG: hypothetical protein P1V81_07210 [Planctomycetota bacterium]|nr:hypothetical protein [Planctomycetota bacterium]
MSPSSVRRESEPGGLSGWVEGRVLVDDVFRSELFRIDLHPCTLRGACEEGPGCRKRSVGLAEDGTFRFDRVGSGPFSLVFRLHGTHQPLRVLRNVTSAGLDPRLAAVELRDELTWAHLDLVDSGGKALDKVRVSELSSPSTKRRLGVLGDGPMDVYVRGSMPAILIECEGFEPRVLTGVAGHLVVALERLDGIG